jgi:hypothetical protein
MEFYSTTKKNEILSFAGKCTELKKIILSEISHAQKSKSLLSHIWIVELKQMQQYCGTGHTKGRLCKRRIGQGKVIKSSNEVDVLTVQE